MQMKMNNNYLSLNDVVRERGDIVKATFTKLLLLKLIGSVGCLHSSPLHPEEHSQRSLPGDPSHLQNLDIF